MNSLLILLIESEVSVGGVANKDADDILMLPCAATDTKKELARAGVSLLEVVSLEETVSAGYTVARLDAVLIDVHMLKDVGKLGTLLYALHLLGKLLVSLCLGTSFSLGAFLFLLLFYGASLISLLLINGKLLLVFDAFVKILTSVGKRLGVMPNDTHFVKKWIIIPSCLTTLDNVTANHVKGDVGVDDATPVAGVVEHYPLALPDAVLNLLGADGNHAVHILSLGKQADGKLNLYTSVSGAELARLCVFIGSVVRRNDTQVTARDVLELAHSVTRVGEATGKPHEAILQDSLVSVDTCKNWSVRSNTIVAVDDSLANNLALAELLSARVHPCVL